LEFVGVGGVLVLTSLKITKVDVRKTEKNRKTEK